MRHFKTLSILFLLTSFLSSCGEKKADADHWTPDLEQHVVGYTSGVISAEYPIVVQLSQDIGLNVVDDHGVTLSATLKVVE